jgi:FkbM family methyltransferase
MAGVDWHRPLRRLGFDVIRWPLGTSEGVDFMALARDTGADVVVDVGANVGDFAATIRARGFGGRIVSFEPGSASYARLEERAAGDPLWDAHRLALGHETGERTLVVTDATDLASFLAVSERGREHFGEHLDNPVEETVAVARLDGVWDDLVRADRALVKIDTQGWDRRVVEGAAGVLDRIAGIQTELAVNGYYEGAPDYLELLAWLRGLGFEPVWFHPVTWHLGVLGEVDCLLRRGR